MPGAGAGVAVAVRTGEIELVEGSDAAALAAAPRSAGTVVGGALLGDESWAACRGVAGVVADLGALSGIEQRVRATPLPGHPGLYVVHDLAPPAGPPAAASALDAPGDQMS